MPVKGQEACSIGSVLGVVVREGGRQLTVGVGLNEQGVGFGLESLHGVGPCSEAGGRLFERDKLHEGFGKLSGVASLLAIHAAPRGDDLLRALGIVADGGVGVGGGVL